MNNMGGTDQAKSQTSKLIAIIDDDESICDSLRDLFESAGLVARCFGSAGDLLESGLHRIQAMREGAVEFLAKPFDHHLLLKTVRAALDM
jgi:FixJ family two-component response regulator